VIVHVSKSGLRFETQGETSAQIRVGVGSGELGIKTGPSTPAPASSTPSQTERHNVFTRYPACTAPFPKGDVNACRALRDQVQSAIVAIESRRHGVSTKRRLQALEARRAKLNQEIKALTVPEEKAS
jgi:hypothetical protein